MIAEKPYYRPDELARAVDVSVETVRRWFNRGLVKHVHLMGVIRIPRSVPRAMMLLATTLRTLPAVSLPITTARFMILSSQGIIRQGNRRCPP